MIAPSGHRNATDPLIKKTPSHKIQKRVYMYYQQPIPYSGTEASFFHNNKGQEDEGEIVTDTGKERERKMI